MELYNEYIYSTKTHYISNSGSDSRGKYYGDVAGDQNGREWWLRDWYYYPQVYGGWSCVLRHPNQNVQLLLARLGCAAALNDAIGYDQWERTTYYDALEEVGFDPSKIKKLCEDDCSAGVCANVKAAGFLLNIDALKNVLLTSTHYMRDMFKRAGFIVLTDKKYLTGYDYLQPGDILLNDNYHTCTNITVGKLSGWKVPSPELDDVPLKAVSKVKFTISGGSHASREPIMVGECKYDGTSVRKAANINADRIQAYPYLNKGNRVDICDSLLGPDDLNRTVTWYLVKITSKGYLGFVHSDRIEVVDDGS